MAVCAKNNLSRIVLQLGCAALIALWTHPAQSRLPDTSGHEILILHSYHKGMLWTDGISQALTHTLRQVQPAVKIHEEYLDTKRYDTASYHRLVADLMYFKYAACRLSAVITSDDNAFRFALRHRPNLFPGTPIVFCGVNNLAVYRQNVNQPLDNVTGVVESFDIRSTLETALDLHPETKTVFIINDRTTTGNSNRPLLERLTRDFAPRVGFEWLEDLSMPALLNAVAHLPINSLILLMSFNRDADGQVFSYLESIQLISASANRPIYGVWGFYIGRGIVGGIVTSGTSQGKTAAEIVKRILRGAPANTIPIVTSSPNRPMFDHHLLERYGIPPERLPSDSIIVNQPSSFYTRYKWYLWGGALVGVMELIIILLLMMNIRQRHRVESHLKQSRERYQRIFENIQDAYYEVNMDGVILEASPSIENVLGFSRKAFIGLPIQKLYRNPADRRPMLDLIMTKRRVVDREVTLLSASGTPVDIAISALVICDAEGQPSKIVGSLRDISRRKEAERNRQTLQQALERSKRMEALGLMAGGVAHDLNNILSGLVTYPELLLMDEKLPPDVRKAIETIQKSGQRAAAVVDDLVTISRGFAGPHAPLDLNAVVDEFLASPEYHGIRQRYPDCRVTKALADRLPALFGSRIHIMKSLMNLVINGFEAIDEAGSKGEVSLSTDHRPITTAVQRYATIPPGDYVVLTVADTGTGIGAEDRERIFEPFYSKKMLGRSGTGLGLTVVWNTLLDHRGYVDVQSDRHGTVFALYFPTTQASPAAEAEPSPQPVHRGQGETVLVVDDEALQRQVASELLSTLGYRPVAVNSGEAAIDHVRENPVDLVLLDMVMDPGINGHETYMEINRLQPGIKAIITSGYAENEDVRKAQEEGAGLFLHKPYTIESLADAVHAALRDAGRAIPSQPHMKPRRDVS